MVKWVQKTGSPNILPVKFIIYQNKDATTEIQPYTQKTSSIIK